MTKQPDDSKLVRLMYYIDQGKHIRFPHEYESILPLTHGKVKQMGLERANNFLFKYTFSYYRLQNT